MRKPKLQVYIEVLDALLTNEVDSNHVQSTNVNCSLLKPILSDLVKNELVEERKKEGIFCYVISLLLSCSHQLLHKERKAR